MQLAVQLAALLPAQLAVHLLADLALICDAAYHSGKTLGWRAASGASCRCVVRGPTQRSAGMAQPCQHHVLVALKCESFHRTAVELKHFDVFKNYTLNVRVEKSYSSRSACARRSERPAQQ